MLTWHNRLMVILNDASLQELPRRDELVRDCDKADQLGVGAIFVVLILALIIGYVNHFTMVPATATMVLGIFAAYEVFKFAEICNWNPNGAAGKALVAILKHIGADKQVYLKEDRTNKRFRVTIDAMLDVIERDLARRKHGAKIEEDSE